jgi:hypothetical protein
MDEYMARFSRIETIAVNFILQESSNLPSSAYQCRNVDDVHA